MRQKKGYFGMKKTISIVTCIMLICSILCGTAIISNAETYHEPFSLSAVDFINQVKAGWNLGNTFEATGRWGEEWRDSYTVNDVETGWGNPTTTGEMFDKVAEQGFNAVRLPVSWYRWVDDDNGYKINPDWMKRIKQVVGYAYKNNMYIILNMHHDDKDWLNIGASDSEWTKIMEKYCAIWTQIANEFKDYDEHLLFEGANEMINSGNWWGSSDDLDRVNDVHKHFVETVRKTGGNNAKRYLMLPTLGAQWYSHQWGSLEIPNNDKHCIIDIHWYAVHTDTKEYEKYMSAIYDGLVSQGTAVVFGECGINKNQSNNKKALWAKAYFGTSSKYKIPTFIWDDGGDYTVLNRRTLKWLSNKQVDAIIDTVGSAEPTTTTTKPTTAPTTKPTTAPTAKPTTAPTTAPTTTEPATTIIYGDLNDDGRINMKDVLSLRKFIAGWNIKINEQAADVNHDGRINMKDVLKLRNFLAGRIDSLD